MSRTNAPYTSEDLAALPKIAERLRELPPVFATSHVPILNCFKTRRCRDCKERLIAADALLKAHAEIVRLQG